MYKEAVVDGPVRDIFLDKRIYEFSILSPYRLVVFPHCSFMNEQLTVYTSSCLKLPWSCDTE